MTYQENLNRRLAHILKEKKDELQTVFENVKGKLFVTYKTNDGLYITMTENNKGELILNEPGA